MRELVTYIDEGFYRNAGTHEAVKNAKLADFFDGDYPAWIKKKTGIRKELNTEEIAEI